VDRLLIMPHNLDIAVLEINNSDFENYTQLSHNNIVSVGDTVIAVGYPTYAQNVLEFSVSEGKITRITDLLMSDGYAFNSIESVAYTNYGSSGGGLFDSKGNLVGITTWKNFGQGTAIAIKINTLKEISNLYYCETGYIYGDKCYNYCSKEKIMGENRQCYGACTDFYCGTPHYLGNDSRCPTQGHVLGSGGYCYPTCGGPTSYCSNLNAHCYNHQCISCPPGTQLYKNGKCY